MTNDARTQTPPNPAASTTPGSTPAESTRARLRLSAADTDLLLLVDDGCLPRVLHWGEPLGELDADRFDQLWEATVFHPGHNGLPTRGYQLSILPEEWTGWSGRPGLSGSRSGRDWAPRFTVTSISLDGQQVPASGFVQVDASERGASLVVEASDAATALSLRIDLEMLPTGLLRGRATVTNDGTDGYQVDNLGLALPVPRRATELLDLCGRWGKERVPQRMPMRMGAHVREGRHGRTGADAASVVHLGEPGFDFQTGEIWAVHTAWSGNHVTYAEQVITGEQVIGGSELLLPGETILDHGQSYASPWLFFNHGTGLDEIAAHHHQFLRQTHPVDTQRPVTLNTWEAVYFDHDADRLIDLAERAAALGVERYVLDDGWFGARRQDNAGLGDWVVSSDMWPKGLHPLVDAVTGLGMQFGLWFEPEMINPDSDLAREHPEWVLQVPGRMPLESRQQWVLNIGIPEAYAHVRDQMMALLDEYAISYIKWDHNRDLLDAGTSPHGRPGVHEQTLAFYRLVDELKAAHPGLEIESCSSGGARIDLEVMQHCDRVWVSDNIDPTDRQQMLCWTAQLMPPELMGSHIASGASHTTGRHHTIDYRAATAVFGHLGIEWDLSQATDAEVSSLRSWIDWYKANRDVLLGGRVVRMDVPQQSGVYLHGAVTPAKAIYGCTMLEQAPSWSIGTIPLLGLEPDATYRVSHLDLTVHRADHHEINPLPEPVEMTGRQLASLGVRAPEVRPEQTRVIVAERL